MSIYAALAGLRPGMASEHLVRLVNARWQPSPGGWYFVGTNQFSAQIDLSGKIASVAFMERFPLLRPVAGLHIGMTLQTLTAIYPDFVMSPKREFPFDLTHYSMSANDRDEITAAVGSRGFVRRLTIWRPGLACPEGEKWTPASAAMVSPFDDTNDTDMLLDWATSFTFIDHYPDFHAIADWLLHRSESDDWHRGVVDWNYDDGLEPLIWIIRQAACDKATALMVFYLLRAGQFVDYRGDRTKVPGHSVEAFDLVTEIRRRFLDGFYTRSTLAFDGPGAFRHEAYCPTDADPADLERDIPRSMRVSIPGRTLSSKRDGNPWRTPRTLDRQAARVVPPPLTAAERAEIERRKLAGIEAKQPRQLARRTAPPPARG